MKVLALHHQQKNDRYNFNAGDVAELALSSGLEPTDNLKRSLARYAAKLGESQ